MTGETAPGSATSSTVRGPALWIKRFELGGSIFLGAVLIIFALVAMGVWTHFESKKQTATFQLALSVLTAERSDLTPPTQRDAVLLKRDGVYHWRALVWPKAEAEKTPFIWSVKVRDTAPLAIEETALVPYDPDLARSLELRQPPL